MRDKSKRENIKIKDTLYQKAYWKGFEDGKKNSIKHNINLLKLQLKNKHE